MSSVYIVIEEAKDWKPYYPSANVITVRDYLFGDRGTAPAGTRIINLCRSYQYLSLGYYCSLLAEARGHRVIPSVRTINDLSHKAIYSLETDDLDALLNKSLGREQAKMADVFTQDIFFGKTVHEQLGDLARQLFETFRCPLLQVDFKHVGKWRIRSIRLKGLARLTEPQEDVFAAALDAFSRDVWRRKPRRQMRYRLAILHNPEDKLPPSNPRALKNFIRVGRSLGIDVTLIERRDYGQLAEYDALFIRETTAINNHTYRFAKKAESEGMVVLDDPASIMRCTNKVYLAELLQQNKVPTPRTQILRKQDLKRLDDLVETLGLPMVLKIPDGSFSRGIVKVSDREELARTAGELLKKSDLILAQEYLYTEFDWRIGVLNKKPIFACQYFMSKGHWQIYQHGPDGEVGSGSFKTYPTVEVPPQVLKVAVKAASLIGDGLYGVDLKQTKDGCYVIEVNDNPNIDAGGEDKYLKDELYRVILEEFIRRLELKCNTRQPA
ncbi:MAG: RimK family protein [Xanthomonadaceae bacterium]|nr:RimK family protein [Xanthomonadaceae bacterium]